MTKLLLLLIIIFMLGAIIFAYLPQAPSYTHAQENDAKSFITVGMDEKEVVNKFGPPTIINPGKDGLEVLQYFAPPSGKATASSYSGFEVFLKDKKVTDLEVIHKSDNQ